MEFSAEEKALIAAALFMCALIVCFNAFDSAYIGKLSINSERPVNHVISSPGTESSVMSEEALLSSPSVQAETEIESVPAVSGAEVQDGVINLNTATADQLADFLPGIGEVKAKAIVEYRENIGGFTSVSQLLNVKGIGQKTYDKIKSYCTVS